MMWIQEEENINADFSGDSSSSAEDERDIQCEILEKQRDEANQKLFEIEEVSSQLLNEMDVLEIQFQIERSCRENAEALALRVTKENKVLKRRSQALMPFIPELPENIETLSFETVDPGVDPGTDEDSVEEAVLQGQDQIRDLQASVDQLLGEKLQLCEEVDVLKREQSLLKEQLILEIAEKESVLKKLTRQNKTLNKMMRVSHLVTEEFTEINQKLELEQDLRQRAEILAHQSLVLQHSSETNLQLQQALEQVAQIKSTLQDIQLHYQNQVSQIQCTLKASSVLAKLQSVRGQLESSKEERRNMNVQLKEAQSTVTQLQGEVKQLQNRLKDLEKDSVSEADQPGEDDSTPAPPIPPPPPPPPLPPPPCRIAVDPLVVLRNKRKASTSNADKNKSDPNVDMKSQAVNEMMERIKNGIVLRPIQRPQDTAEEESSWRDQRIEKRKSAVLELKGMLDTMKRTGHRTSKLRKRISRNVGEAELLLVLQRRRRALGNEFDTTSSVPPTSTSPTIIQDPQLSGQAEGSLPLAEGSLPLAEGCGSSPVLRRLQQNREKRNSSIRASQLFICQEEI